MEKSPIKVLTFKETMQCINDAVQKGDIRLCDVLCIDFDADCILFVTESNMSTNELREAWINGDVIFVQRC